MILAVRRVVFCGFSLLVLEVFVLIFGLVSKFFKDSIFDWFYVVLFSRLCLLKKVLEVIELLVWGGGVIGGEDVTV